MWNQHNNPIAGAVGAVQNWANNAVGNAAGGQQSGQQWQSNNQQQHGQQWQNNNNQQQQWGQNNHNQQQQWGQSNNNQQQQWGQNNSNQWQNNNNNHNNHNSHNSHNNHNQQWQQPQQQQQSWQQNNNHGQSWQQNNHGGHNQHHGGHNNNQHHGGHNQHNGGHNQHHGGHNNNQHHGGHGGHGGHNSHNSDGGNHHGGHGGGGKTVPLQKGATMPRWYGRSDKLVDAPTGHDVRQHYLHNPLGPPVISRSPFIPTAMVEHLMRRKKDLAISVKYVPGDAITNMEGVAHTFVTPLVFARVHGDYAYKGKHTMLPFSGRARECVVSTAIQPDFEDTEGMMALARLEHHPIQGQDWPQWGSSIPSPHEKANPHTRAGYDARIRAHLIHHLIGRLPAVSEVKHLSVKEAISHLEHGGRPHGLAVRLPKAVVSLELLFRVYAEQLSNELSALESLCKYYVYTIDPPAIFARECDATLLNRLQGVALGHLVRLNPGRLKHMRMLAFNDYADKKGSEEFGKHIYETTALFTTKAYLWPDNGYYNSGVDAEGALLVLHNNSDGFGQNIEFEGPGGSMDGAIGCASSVAGSLRRDRHDLLSQIYRRGERMRVRKSG